MDRDDVRVIEGGDGTCLALESGEALGIACDVLWKNLERDVAGQTRIVGAVHRAHAASAERAADLIGTESGSGHEGHGQPSLCHAFCRVKRTRMNDGPSYSPQFGQVNGPPRY